MSTLTHHRSFKTGVDIPEAKRTEVIDLLNARLADAIDLKTQAKQAHWNVKGLEFFQLHGLFDQVATHQEEASDLIAERVAALGGYAMGTARLVAASSALNEYNLDAVKGEEHVRALAQQLAKLANSARKGIDQCTELGDQATADLFTEVVRQADKDLWFLEAHLQA